MFPVLEHQVINFRFQVNITTSNSKINKTRSSDFQELTSAKITSFKLQMCPAATLSDRETCNLFVVKDSTNTNTVRKQNTET